MAGHHHGTDLGDVRVSARARVVLLAALAVGALLTVVGLVRLWPDAEAVRAVGADVAFAAPGVTLPHARITALNETCETGGQFAEGFEELAEDGESPEIQEGPACWLATVTVTDGDSTGEEAEVQLQGPVTEAGLEPGDTVQLLRIPGAEGGPAIYSFFSIDRTAPLGWLTLAFVVVVLAVARLRGLLALVGLVFAGWVVVKFLLPGLLVGESTVAVVLVAASAIMYVVLYLAHGPSVRTSTALAGTLVGVGLTALLAQVAVGATKLTGVGDETGALLSTFVTELDFRALLTGAIIIAGLGVLNDVTITQSSAVWELRAAGPGLTRRQLFGSGMRIGRDHIASTIYTIVFAYAGAALSVLLLLYLYDRPVLDLLSTEDLATEAARTLCSAIGLVLAVPVTTAIAAATVSGARPEPAEPDLPAEVSRA